MPANFGNARYLIQTVLDKTGATQFKREMENVQGTASKAAKELSKETNIIAAKYQRLGKIGSTSMRKFSTTVVDAEGNLKTFSGVQGKVNGQWTTFNNTVKSTNGTLGSFNKTIAGSTAGLLGAAKRALVVIPVWLALRSVISGFVNTIRLGVEHIVEFDKALARARAVAAPVTQDLDSFMEQLESRVRSLARETGTSAGDIAELFYRMGTAGLNAEEGLAGMELALRTSIAIMGDATDTAVLLADIYNLMGDRIEGAITPTEKMTVVASTIATLWTSNAFTLDEFTGALKTFVPTAKNYNLSLDQMLGLTATAATLMSRGATAGTQLSRSFLQLYNNTEALERILGRTVNLQTEDSFQLLTEVLLKLNNQLKEGENIATKVIEVFGVKGSKTINSFAGGLEKLSENLDKLSNNDATARAQILNTLFELQIDTIDRQINIFNELRKQITEGFLEGFTGASNYVDALKNINSFIEEKLLPSAFLLAEALRVPFVITDEIKAGEGGRAKRLFEEANPELSRLNSIDSTGRRKGKPEVDKAFEEFIANAEAIADPLSRAKFIQEELNVDLNQAADLMDFISRAAFKYTNYLNGTEARGGLSQQTEQFEKQKELKKLISENEEEIATSTNRQIIEAEKLLGLGYSQLAVEKEKLRILGEQNQGSKEYAKQYEKILQLTIKQANEASLALQETFSQGLSDVFQGDSDFYTLFENVGNKIRQTISDAVADSITEQIFTSTGIGGTFGELIGGIRSGADRVKFKEIEGHTQGAEILYDRITAAHKAGAEEAMSLIGGGVGDVDGNPLAGSSGSAGAGGIGGRLNSLLSKKFFASPGAAGNTGLLQGGGISAGGALSVFGAVSTGQSLAKNAPGSGDVFGSALTGASSFGAAGFALGGPLGAAIGAGIGAIFGAIQGGKSKTTVETDQQTLKVASKIDVTNKKLEVLNRNFVALKTNIETYILPDTAYFSTNRNLEDNFSINARRGFA